jgi:hypothetical protein
MSISFEDRLQSSNDVVDEKEQEKEKEKEKEKENIISYQTDKDLMLGVDWFASTYLQAVHHHPKDLTIQYTKGRSFYVRWFETPQNSEDTISVSILVDKYIAEHPNFKHHSSLTSQDVSLTRRQDGVHLHRVIECMFNGYSEYLDSVLPLHQQIHHYYLNHIQGNFVPWRSEMAIRSNKDLRIVGVVDMMFMKIPEKNDVSTTLNIYLKDWKYSRNVKSCMELYKMQLNLYKFILESEYIGSFWVGTREYTGIHIVSMDLIVFHEDFECCQIHTVEGDEELLSDLLRFRKKVMTEIKK